MRSATLTNHAREAFAQSLLGIMFWTLAVTLLAPGWSPALLAFGPLVLYPLLFDTLGDAWRSMRRFMLPAFLPVLASYGLDQGTIAGILALPWLVFTLVLFVHRLRDDIRERQFVLLLIKSYLIVGAAWLVLARLGQRPLDYEHAIVHATAVHFHYAGFVLPILALHWMKAAPSRYRLAVLSALLAGVPMVALGITLSAFQIRWFELVAVGFFVAACVWYAVEQFRLAFAHDGIARFALILSSVALMAAMGLAFLYAVGNFARLDWLNIPLMLRTHGPIQVFGFALPGVVAWTIIRRSGCA